MKNLFAISLICFALAACDTSPNAWKSGDYGGKGKMFINADSSSKSPPEVVETGTGSFIFSGSSNSILMGQDTPLRDCNIDIDFGPGTEEKAELTNYYGAYRGDTKNDLGCLGFIGSQSFRIEIEGGSIERDQAGETVLTVRFRKNGSSSEPELKYDLRGHKTSSLKKKC